jgi:hypothetical protein
LKVGVVVAIPPGFQRNGPVSGICGRNEICTRGPLIWGNGAARGDRGCICTRRNPVQWASYNLNFSQEESAHAIQRPFHAGHHFLFGMGTPCSLEQQQLATRFADFLRPGVNLKHEGTETTAFWYALGVKLHQVQAKASILKR